MCVLSSCSIWGYGVRVDDLLTKPRLYDAIQSIRYDLPIAKCLTMSDLGVPVTRRAAINDDTLFPF